MKPRAALLLLLPAMVFYVLTFVGPMLLAGRLSLFRSDYVTYEWVAVDNYVAALRDPFFLKSFMNSFIQVLMIAPVMIVWGYAVASFLSTFSKGMQGVGRFVIYIPGLASGLIMALLWQWLLWRGGVINTLLGRVGMPAVPWLSEAWPARVSVSLACVSSGVGGYVIPFSAGMAGVPSELKDAALIDGCSPRQYRRYIVRPLMVPTILLMVLLAIVGIMQMWETLYVLTGEGGPEGSTASPVYEIFQTAFRFGKPGYAAAKGIILTGVIAGILAVKQRVEKWAR